MGIQLANYQHRRQETTQSTRRRRNNPRRVTSNVEPQESPLRRFFRNNASTKCDQLKNLTVWLTKQTTKRSKGITYKNLRKKRQLNSCDLFFNDFYSRLNAGERTCQVPNRQETNQTKLVLNSRYWTVQRTSQGHN
jgi:hypothetical protein